MNKYLLLILVLFFYSCKGISQEKNQVNSLASLSNKVPMSDTLETDHQNMSNKETNDWHVIVIPHSQKDTINLFARQVNEFVEVYITAKEKVFLHDKLIGKIEDITYDQFKTEVLWKFENASFDNRPVEFDMASARVRNGSQDKLEYLKYHIANAINSSLSNKEFSRYLKSKLPGTWTSDNFQLTFTDNKHMTSEGKAPERTILFSMPSSGTWSIARNMLGVMNNGVGIRTQIVDIVDDKLFFPGNNCQLFYIMKKK